MQMMHNNSQKSSARISQSEQSAMGL